MFYSHDGLTLGVCIIILLGKLMLPVRRYNTSPSHMILAQANQSCFLAITLSEAAECLVRQSNYPAISLV